MNYTMAYKKQAPELCRLIGGYGAPKAKFIECDFSANDMSQVKDVHIVEAMWFAHLGAPLWLIMAMDAANIYKVYSRKHGISAIIENQLPSGSQSTTFRNSVWNITIANSFVRKFNVKGHTLVLGDDMLMRMDSSLIGRRIARAYKWQCDLARMKSKVKVHDHLVECEFLSRHFARNDVGYVMVPKLGKALGRFNARANANRSVTDRVYLAGKSLSYAYEFRAAPHIQALFLKRFLSLEVDFESLSTQDLGYVAKGNVLQYGFEGLMARMKAPYRDRLSADNLTEFFYSKYTKTGLEILALVSDFLFGEDDLDLEFVGRLAEDFL
jgi:hypothetical protein